MNLNDNHEFIVLACDGELIQPFYFCFKPGVIVQGIFAKIGPDLELRWGDLISSPVDSIVSLDSPKKVTDPTLWGEIIYRPRPFHF